MPLFACSLKHRNHGLLNFNKDRHRRRSAGGGCIRCSAPLALKPPTRQRATEEHSFG